MGERLRYGTLKWSGIIKCVDGDEYYAGSGWLNERFGTAVADRLAFVLADIDTDGFEAVGDTTVDSASGDDLIGRIGASDAQLRSRMRDPSPRHLAP